MTAQPATTETTEYTIGIVTDDGETITPTKSPTKPDLFDRSVPWIVAVVTMLVVVGIGFAFAFHMGISAQKYEITSTTTDARGNCLKAESFMISGTETGMRSGEYPEVFAQYQAKHPDEKASDVPCPIAWENNTAHH
jgi:hypothetical protein